MGFLKDSLLWTLYKILYCGLSAGFFTMDSLQDSLQDSLSMGFSTGFSKGFALGFFKDSFSVCSASSTEQNQKSQDKTSQ